MKRELIQIPKNMTIFSNIVASFWRRHFISMRIAINTAEITVFASKIMGLDLRSVRTKSKEPLTICIIINTTKNTYKTFVKFKFFFMSPPEKTLEIPHTRV